MPKNWKARDKKLERRRNGKMLVTNRSIFVIQAVIAKKGKEAKDKANGLSR